MNVPMIDYQVRQMSEVDRPFIMSTWLKTFHSDSVFTRNIKPVIFFENHKRVVSHILARPETKVFVAALKDDENVILGYCVVESKTIHWVYIKPSWRELGIATRLINHAGINEDTAYFSHWTFRCEKITRKHRNLVYNPYKM